jgi:hypothetical protein
VYTVHTDTVPTVLYPMMREKDFADAG